MVAIIRTEARIHGGEKHGHKYANRFPFFLENRAMQSNREKQVPASKAEALFLFHTDTCSLFLLCLLKLKSCNGFLKSRIIMINATFYDAIPVEMSDFLGMVEKKCNFYV